jgi:iron complex outermembrane receptor protein
VNADIFQINYKGQLNQFQGIPYFNSVSNDISQTSIAFVRNQDARVRGVEAEISAEPIRNLTLNLNLGYAHIQSVGGQAPCVDPSRPVTAANLINFCAVPSGATLNSSAPFQGSFNGDYTVPIGPIDGYLRFNVNYQGHNPNFGASQIQAKAYTLVDPFAGLTAKEGRWDIGLYAKNVFDKKVLLASSPYITGFGL